MKPRNAPAVCDIRGKTRRSFFADEVVETGAKQSYIRYQPLGPVFGGDAVEIFRSGRCCVFAAPALMAGNVGAAEARFDRAAERAVD